MVRLQTTQDGKIQNFDEKKSKMGTEILQIFDFFLEISFVTSAFKVLVFASDLDF